MTARRRLTTDQGTAVLHGLLVLSFLYLLLTGLRIATDDPAAEWLSIFDMILPMEDIWLRHLSAGLVFGIVLLSYAAYVRSARLTSRIRFDATRLIGLIKGGPPRRLAVSVLIFWALMASLVGEVVTGAALFGGADRFVMDLHLDLTWACLGLILAHVATHALSGGLAQVSRVLHPVALHVPPPVPDLAEVLAEQLSRYDALVQQTARASAGAPRMDGGTTLRAHPAVSAVAAAMLAASGAYAWIDATATTLTIPEIEAGEAPRLDGDLSDPAWLAATPVTVTTSQGGDFGGSGQSTVEVRAVHDASYVYFAFVWSDPTRSLKAEPLVKRADGWQVLTKPLGPDGETTFREDKFAVLFAQGVFPLIGAAIHLSPRPISDRPAARSGRGLHYLTNGGIADLWEWSATRSARGSHIGNGHFGAPAAEQTDDAMGDAHYLGRIAFDHALRRYGRNYDPAAAGGEPQRVTPRRLPAWDAATARAVSAAAVGSDRSDAESPSWILEEAETVPFTAGADRAMPIGSVIPGLIARSGPEGPEPSAAVGRWAAGRWTLEFARRLYTGSKLDVPIKSGTLMWLAAFDHAELRHTRHLRPITLEVE
jgi:cytochrome b subunit of formate dehydrogenase